MYLRVYGIPIFPMGSPHATWSAAYTYENMRAYPARILGFCGLEQAGPAQCVAV